MVNKSILTAVVALFVATSAFSQTYKYGHMNLGNLVEQLPDVKAAEAQLKTFGDKLAAKDDSLTTAFRADAEKFQKDYQAGILTALQAKTQQEALQKRQQAIQEFEENAQKLVAAKRQDLLKPILDKVQDAVKAVAKESGYSMIFDTSSGAALFAQDSDDITALVKKKLGI